MEASPEGVDQDPSFCFAAYMNVSAGYRDFCVQSLRWKYRAELRSTLEETLLILKCGASLRVKTPYPDDPLALAKRISLELWSPSSVAKADDVRELEFSHLASARQLKLVPLFPKAESVFFYTYCIAHGEDLAPLAAMPDLRSLELGQKFFIEESATPYFKQIGACRKLEKLKLEFEAQAPADFAALADLTELKSLETGARAVSLEGLGALARLKHLERLSLKMQHAVPGVRLTGIFTPLAAAPTLRILQLSGPLEELDLAEFGAFAKLEELEIRSSSESGKSFKGVEGLAKLHSLAKLSLPGEAIGPGLQKLVPLKSLRTLRFTGGARGQKALEEFRKARRDVDIAFD